MASNIKHIFTKEDVKLETVEDHVRAVDAIIKNDPEFNMAITILVDNKAGFWDMNYIVSGMTNGESFMAIKLFESEILKAVRMED